MLNRKNQPQIQPPGIIKLPVPAISELDNGIKVYQFNSGKQNVSSIEMVFEAGSRYQQKPFTAMAANLMLREGTKHFSARELAEKLDYFGAHFENATERDNAYVSLYSLNKHLNNTLPLLNEIVRNPIFAATEYEVLAGKQRQMLEVNRQKVNFLARTHFNALIFGSDHPYGKFLLPEDIGNVSSQDLIDFHQNYYHSGNCTIVAAGKIPDNLLADLNRLFGGRDWLKPSVPKNEFTGVPAEGMMHFIEKQGAMQSAIRIGRKMFSRSHPDFAGMKVLNAILGGYFGSRLMMNLREDKGYTYGIGSAVVPLQQSGYFVISGEVGTDVTTDALKEIKSELLRLCNDIVPDDELSLVRSYLSGEMLRAVDGPFAQAAMYRELIEDGLNNSHFEMQIETVQQITAVQLRDLAIKYLNPDELTTLVVGAQKV